MPESTRTPQPLGVAQHRPGLRQPVGVLGGDARLDRVPGHDAVPRPLLARGDPQLDLDEVQPRDELRDRVLDLQPRVHLEEVVLAEVVGVDDELDGAGVLVAGRPRDAATPRRSSVRAQRPSGIERGRLLDDLLVAALQRALALAEGDVADDLHLDVPRPLDVLLDEDAVVAEAGLRLALRRGDRRPRARPPSATTPHAAAAAAGGGLDHHRIARPPSPSGTTGTPADDGQLLARGPCPRPPRSRPADGPMKTTPASSHARAKRGVLAQEAVAGMDGVDVVQRRDGPR